MYDQPTGKRKLLDGRDRDVFATPRRFVRLGPNGNNLVSVLQTTTQGRNSCRRCAHENYAHRLVATVIRRFRRQKTQEGQEAGSLFLSSAYSPRLLLLPAAPAPVSGFPASALLLIVAPSFVAETLACINSRRYSRPPAFES